MRMPAQVDRIARYRTRAIVPVLTNLGKTLCKRLLSASIGSSAMDEARLVYEHNRMIIARYCQKSLDTRVGHVRLSRSIGGQPRLFDEGECRWVIYDHF
jgi:hypothetical protein